MTKLMSERSVIRERFMLDRAIGMHQENPKFKKEMLWLFGAMAAIKWIRRNGPPPSRLIWEEEVTLEGIL